MTCANRIAYLDCFSGISGDMLLAALLHAGLDAGYLRAELAKLDLPGWQLDINTTSRQGIAARQIRVTAEKQQTLRHLADLTGIITHSTLAPVVQQQSLAVLTALADAEAEVHGIPREKVHFHEIGAIDTLIDIVGCCLGLPALGVARLVAAPLPLGRGFVDCAHGRLPLPAPAVCLLLRGLPSYGIEARHELVTPTGAALLRVLADDFGSQPPMRTTAVGYGAGQRDPVDGPPNLLRLSIGEPFSASEAQRIRVIECNLDDWQSEGFPYLSQQLLAAGAVDVSLTPILMKKGRPGYCLQVLCPMDKAFAVQQLIFAETTAIGLRWRDEERQTLAREIVQIATPWGMVNAKKVQTPSGSRIYPEYEACRQLASAVGVPLQDIYQAVCQGRPV